MNVRTRPIESWEDRSGAAGDTPAVQVSSDDVEAVPAKWSAFFPLSVVAVYIAIALIAFWPLLPGTSDRLFGTGGDSILASWFLAWVPHSLAHGLNPFFSKSIFVPSGVNLAQNTQAPLLGLITTPFALFLNPIARANLLMVMAMPVSATAAFVVLRKWKVWEPAAALGGLIYGFSPFAIGQGLGHLVLVFAPFPPFIALTLASIIQRRGSPRRLGVQLGLLMAAQFLCEAELMTTLALFMAAAVVLVMLRHPARSTEVARAIVLPASIAVGVVGMLLAYPIWMMLAGPQHYTGTAQPIPNPFNNDLLSFVAPGPLQKVSLGMRSLGLRLDSQSNPSEATAYIGIPLIIVAAVLAWRSRRSPRMQLTVILLLGALILSLGPHLVVDGRRTAVRLPFIVLAHTPLLNNILPSRLTFEVDACIAALVAFGLGDVRRSISLRRRQSLLRRNQSTILAGIALASVVVFQLPVWPYESQLANALPLQIRSSIPAGDPAAITYPFASPLFAQPMLWQQDDSFAFRLVGGYAMHPAPNGGPTGFPSQMDPPGLQLFLEGQEGFSPDLPRIPISDGLVSTTRAAFSRYDIRLVIVDQSMAASGAVIDLFTQTIGPPTISAGHFVLWASPHGPL